MQHTIANYTYLNPEVLDKLIEQGLSLHKSSVINRNLLFNGPVHFYGDCCLSRVQIDAYSYVNSRSIINTTKIGRYCSIGNNVDIGMPFHDYKRPSSSSSFYKGSHFELFVGELPLVDPFALEHQGSISAEPIIGNDVWIGSHVKIPASVTIGHGAVIGTNAVITRDVPPYAIIQTSSNNSSIGENDLKYRFSDEVISDLLELNWWDYDIPRMLAKGRQVPVTNVQDFISFFKNEDPSTLLRIQDRWHLVIVLSADQVQLVPGQKDMFFDFHAVDLPD